MDYSKIAKNPISEIIFAISEPCFNLAVDYVARPIKINDLVIDRQTCAKNDGEIDAHTLFYPTSYGVNELSVY